MSKLSFALSILVLPCAFLLAQAQAVESKAGTATVSGRVILKGEPARGVMVILQTQYQSQFNAPRARTDESGRFHFTGLTAGRYSVSALSPGYTSPEDSNLPGIRGKTLTLADGSFALSNIAPGKYWLVARAVPDDEPGDGPPPPAAWDAVERAKLRKEAAAMKVEIELKPCQRVTDQIVKYIRSP